MRPEERRGGGGGEGGREGGRERCRKKRLSEKTEQRNGERRGGERDVWRKDSKKKREQEGWRVKQVSHTTVHGKPQIQPCTQQFYSTVCTSL